MTVSGLAWVVYRALGFRVGRSAFQGFAVRGLGISGFKNQEL